MAVADVDWAMRAEPEASFGANREEGERLRPQLGEGGIT